MRSPRRPGGPAPQRRRDRVHGVEVSSVAAGPESRPLVAGAAPRTADVVLVHGLAVSNRYLVPCLRGLATDRRVFAPDLPGVGRSSNPTRRLTMTELADGLRDWMDVVGVGRAVVVGHSLGCQTVALLADRHPDRVAAVVLASPSRNPQAPPLWRQAGRLLVDGFRERPSLVLIALTDYTRVGLVRMLRRLREASRADAEVDLGRIRQPTLVVHGDRDPLDREGWAGRLAELLPAGSLVTIPDAPHGVPYSAVGPFVAAVRDFLDSVVSPGVSPPRDAGSRR